ncbi:hypothetical protein GGF37_001777 [Kickxella alabastrina]|nr:hypothetical protein GGF37_001777 [Kickxella alabastrina]
MSRLRALHKDGLCLDIKVSKIRPTRKLLKGSDDADNNNSNVGKFANGVPHSKKAPPPKYIDNLPKMAFIILLANQFLVIQVDGICSIVWDILSALNHPNPSTLDCKLYVEYLLECRKGDFILGEHYHNTQTLGKSRKYDGSSSNDPLHRKLRYLFFVNRKRADVELAKSGPDPVLIFSNWIPSMTCHRESIRGKGLQEMLIGVPSGSAEPESTAMVKPKPKPKRRNQESQNLVLECQIPMQMHSLKEAGGPEVVAVTAVVDGTEVVAVTAVVDGTEVVAVTAVVDGMEVVAVMAVADGMEVADIN